MANNRLYLMDDERKEYIFIAKGWGNGWDLWTEYEQLEDFLRSRDMSASYDARERSKLRLATEAESLEGYERLLWDRGQWERASSIMKTHDPDS